MKSRCQVETSLDDLGRDEGLCGGVARNRLRAEAIILGTTSSGKRWEKLLTLEGSSAKRSSMVVKVVAVSLLYVVGKSTSPDEICKKRSGRFYRLLTRTTAPQACTWFWVTRKDIKKTWRVLTGRSRLCFTCADLCKMRLYPKS